MPPDANFTPRPSSPAAAFAYESSLNPSTTPNASISSQPQLITGSSIPSNLGRGTARVLKRSSKAPISVFRRAAAFQAPFKERSHKSRGLIRPMPTPALFPDPLRMHPPTGLKTSISAPLETLSPNVSNTSASGVKQSTEAAMTPEDVQAKVENMLTATRVLKPGANDAVVPASRRSRLAFKFRKALSFSGKKDFQPRFGDTAHKRLSAILAASSTSPVQRRLNESQNLQSPKIQRVAGNKIPRKPVPMRQKTDMAQNDPRRAPHINEETMSKLIGTELNAQATSEPSTSDSTVPITNDPFTEESEFEEDFENGLLKTIPDGASTPRVLSNNHLVVNGASRAANDPEKSYISSSHPEPHSDSSTSPDDYDALVDMILESPVATGHPVLNVPDGNLRVKKHPSPGREWFENIDKLMQPAYGRMQAEGGSKAQLDELAEDLSALGSLTERESNRLASNKLSTSSRCRSHYLRGSSRSSSDPRRLTRNSPLTQPFESSRQLRPARLLRPRDVQADEVDELL